MMAVFGLPVDNVHSTLDFAGGRTKTNDGTTWVKGEAKRLDGFAPDYSLSPRLRGRTIGGSVGRPAAGICF